LYKGKGGTHGGWNPTGKGGKVGPDAWRPSPIDKKKKEGISLYSLSIQRSRVEKREILLSLYLAKPSRKERNFISHYSAKPSRRRGKYPFSLFGQTE